MFAGVRAGALSVMALSAWLAGCGGGDTMDAGAHADGGDGGALADGTVGDSGPTVVPPGLQLRPHAVNIVDSAAADEVRRYVLGEEPQLHVGAATFYAHFDDEYDFLYVFTDAPVPMTTARYTPVRREALPSVGISSAYEDPGYGGHARLRAAVGVSFSMSGNGPTLHETLHHWGTFLDARFGFGRDRDIDFGPHWGVASVHGQHGGFDLATVRCSMPPDAPPPCSADTDGVIRVTTDEFGPAANGGDSLPYAPIELYLMGLMPRAEVPSPIVVLDGAHFVSQDASTRRMSFEITGTHEVTMDDIVAVHGERPAAPPEERAYRAAFVSFSDVPLSAERMDALERWAAVFGNDATTPGLLSFEEATDGRATMSTRLGVAR